MSTRKINAKVWGTRGTSPNWYENRLGTAVFVGEDSIFVSRFYTDVKGSIKRDVREPNIEIEIDGEVLFEGTMQELKERLTT